MSQDPRANEKSQARGWAIGMALVAGLVRLIPHPFNFTPIDGLGLFGGARLRSFWSYLLPLVVMAVSDVALWFVRGHHEYSFWAFTFNPWVYVCLLLTVFWGRLLLRNAGVLRLTCVSLLVSVQFFLVTNFAVWYSSSLDPASLPEGRSVVFVDDPTLPAPIPTVYARNASGLLACYVAALPFVGSNAPPLGFLGNQLVGDLFYTGVLFGAFALLRGRAWKTTLSREPVAARTP